ncbi:hypothetical protein BGW36DRAFT_459332 [Talaromyces proteolyticus]|uniref:Zn(2)-C6 fungal-type domain-containing protein n=1 Tax=Talaromyces proteolyticus TaxID=1131652 RepID=A0AAD4KVQ0_9EURO|nr:uncharacterized protein BGW36DRAFT_459332 [Talaromyces proteolyticus]KAH8700097.1 hypothetical protein BGW36DRAFT_459332 [Talaromyces proteolyticus]
MSGISKSRRWHNKSRAGCRTCKTRRIKCDQTWPSCENCTTARRHCDGYDRQPRAMLQRYHMSLEHFRASFCCAAPKPLPGRWGTCSAKELRSLEHFQNRTAPMLAGYFHSDVWSVLPLYLSETEPAILPAVIALSAYHESSEQVDSPLTDGDPLPRFVLQFYTTAISLFRGSLLSDGLKPLAISFSPCLRGVELYQRSQTEIPLSLYGRPRRCDFPTLLDVPDIPPKSQGRRFDNLNEARMSSTVLLNSTFRFVRMAVTGCIPDPFTELSIQRSLQTQLQDWHLAFEAFVISAGATVQDPRGPCLLRVHHILAVAFLSDALPDRESAFDLCTTQFEAIVTSLEFIMSEDRLRVGSQVWCFGLDTGIIAPLFFTAIKCRDASIRRALGLLSRVPRYEGLWDAQESAHAAEIAIDFEEGYRTAAPRASIPGWARLQDVDICRRDAADPSRQLVVLRWQPDGIDGDMQGVHKYIQW